MRTPLGREWRSALLLVTIAAAVVVFGVSSAQALQDTWSTVVPSSTRAYSQNGVHSYQGDEGFLNYIYYDQEVCSKGVTRDFATIVSGNHPCSYHSGSVYPLNNINCLPGSPLVYAYSYFIGSGNQSIGGQARTGSCY